MNIDKKMKPVIDEVGAILNADGDAVKAVEIKAAIDRWNLDKEELRYLCRHFGVLTEDIFWG